MQILEHSDDAIKTAPRFSVVIPTRNRPETLRSCLATCVTVDFEDVEFLVMDNSDATFSDEARSISASFRDTRVRFVRNPNSPCSMSRNWSHGILEAAGQYITVCGDDDGVLTHAFRVAKLALDSVPPNSVLSWPNGCYRWPNCAEISRRNLLSLPYGTRSTTAKLRRVNPQKLLSSVVHKPWTYHQLPMLYNSFVPKQIVLELQNNSGDLLLGQSPDIYSGVAISATCRNLYVLDLPLTLQGLSGSSNGLAFMAKNGDTSIQSDFSRLNAQDGRDKPMGTSGSTVYTGQVIDSLSRLANVRPEHRRLLPTVTETAALELHDLLTFNSFNADLAVLLEKMLAYYANNADATKQIQAAIANIGKSADHITDHTNPKGIGHGVAYIDGNMIGLSTIFDACRVASSLLATECIETETAMKRTKSLIRRFLPPLFSDAVSRFVNSTSQS